MKAELELGLCPSMKKNTSSIYPNKETHYIFDFFGKILP